MHRELNPAGEMLRRILYIIYLLLMASTFVLGLMALAQQRLDYLTATVAVAVAGLVLRAYGRRWLDFERLARSFPYGTPEEEPADEVRREVEQILRISARLGGDWMRRQKLRTRLIELLRQDPRLWQVFRKEIDGAFPALAAWVGGSEGNG